MGENELEKTDGGSLSFDSRLEKVTLSDKEISEINKDKTIKMLRDEGINLFGPIGKVATKIIGWHEEKENELKKEKERKLLEKYFNKTAEQFNMINKLKNFVTDPYGFTIFSKIRSILNDNTPPDSELIEHLSTVLTNIVNAENYEYLFKKTKYVLGQIERLTPQFLTVLSDESEWPVFEMNASTYTGGKISSDFHDDFGKAYANEKGITNEDTINRIIHSIRELENANLLEGYKIEDGHRSKNNECRLTEVGEEIAQYLK